MRTFKFQLSRKHKCRCPSCGRPKKFSPYVDTDTDIPIDAEACGMCDRIYNCGYHLPPKEYFKTHSTKTQLTLDKYLKPKHTKPKPQIYMIDKEKALKSLNRTLGGSGLYDFLFKTLISSKMPKAIKKDVATSLYYVYKLYRVTKGRYYDSSTIFYLCDCSGRFCDGKIMVYDPNTGHRVKDGRPAVTWCSAVEARKSGLHFENTNKPFFGEHLLPLFSNARVAVFESEKTALIMAVCLHLIFGDKVFERYLPIATGGAQMLSTYKLGTLSAWLDGPVYEPIYKARRSVTFFPDNGMADLWQDKIAILSKSEKYGPYVSLCRVLENDYFMGVAIEQGSDLADIFFERAKIFDTYVAMNDMIFKFTNIINS